MNFRTALVFYINLCYNKVYKILKKGYDIMISYLPMNVTLAKHDIKRTKMAEDLGISPPTLAKFNKNKSVNLQTLEKICIYLDCRIEDIVEIKKG